MSFQKLSREEELDWFRIMNHAPCPRMREHARDVLFESIHAWVLNRVRIYARTKDEFDEMLGQASLEILGPCLKKYDGSTRLSTYVTQAVHWCCVKIRNPAKHRITAQLRLEGVGDEEILAREHVPPNPDRERIKELLKEGLRKLDERSTLIMVLRFQEGYTYKQIGAQLGISKERVRQLISKGLKIVGEHFEASTDYRP